MAQGNRRIKIAMTTRRWMAVLYVYAIVLWISIALGRTFPVRPHLKPMADIPGTYDYRHCPRRPFGAKFLSMVLGEPWPGDYVCPDHPKQRYIEDPRYYDGWW